MDKKLLEILVCPLCRGELKWQAQSQELECAHDQLAFPVRDGIPVMLPEEARALSAQAQDEGAND